MPVVYYYFLRSLLTPKSCLFILIRSGFFFLLSVVHIFDCLFMHRYSLECFDMNFIYLFDVYVIYLFISSILCRYIWCFHLICFFCRVQNLKETIERLHGIPSANQVLLISGGEVLQPSSRVCSYSSGTDENPIYMFSTLFDSSKHLSPWPSIESRKYQPFF